MDRLLLARKAYTNDLAVALALAAHAGDYILIANAATPTLDETGIHT